MTTVLSLLEESNPTVEAWVVAARPRIRVLMVTMIESFCVEVGLSSFHSS